MSDWAIIAEHLGKKYVIRHQRDVPYLTLGDLVVAKATQAVGRLGHPLGKKAIPDVNPRREDFWAVQDLTFTVKRGESVGIIGRNGAGKSTLLKLLSRITSPTVGRLGIRGRVASLLEVGTGFHQELSGRENIYLNGAVLGMSRAEIKSRFDEIVAFAEVENFLDTPVKRYSSGMYMRLAFAVAAHLEPEILIVDEVLAVGDASFQKKCLNKLEDVGQEGRTVLFVSHNMAAITRLCTRAILLDEGHVVVDGPAPSIARMYSGSGVGMGAVREWTNPSRAPGDDIARLCAVRVRNAGREIVDHVDIRGSVGVEMEYDVLVPGHVLVPNIHFFNDAGICMFMSNNLDPAWYEQPRPVGRFVSTVWIPGNFFAEGSVMVRAALTTYAPFVVHIDVHDAVAFQVVDSIDGNSARGIFTGFMPGVVRPILTWTEQQMLLDESGESVMQERIV